MRTTLALLAAFCLLPGFGHPNEEQHPTTAANPGVGLNSELGGFSQAKDDYLPIVKVLPMYPRTPQSRGLEGYCDLEFTVTRRGTTADVRVIECTSSLFERASVDAVLKFKYKPRLVNGRAIAVPGVRHRITFQMDEWSQQAVESGLLDEYKARIRQRIERNWQRPAATREDLIWVVLLNVLPGNAVDDLTFEQFNGTEADRRSIETAIRRSSPLPAPPVPELFERELRIRYPASVPEATMANGEALPIVRVDPQYPREALMDGTEGYVKFELLIGTDGSVREIKVTEAVPGRIFVLNAVRAVRLWKFRPHIVDGVPEERWVKSSIVFEL